MSSPSRASRTSHSRHLTWVQSRAPYNWAAFRGEVILFKLEPGMSSREGMGTLELTTLLPGGELYTAHPVDLLEAKRLADDYFETWACTVGMKIQRRSMTEKPPA